MPPHTLLSSLLAATLLGGTAHASSGASVPPPPLRILLTNDDGVSGAGLLLLRDTLCAAGHQVSVSAPAADRSGTSAALTLNQIIRVTRTEFSCNATPSPAWAVGATPSDAVLFGLSALGEARPELVISGMNSGQNVGRAVNHSGTVGAAVTAAEEGVPSIAVSIAINVQDAGTGFSQTTAAAPHAAAFVKTLIDRLRATARPGEPLLPDRVALNVNYPVVLDAQGQFAPALVKGPRITFVGHGEVVRPQYLPVPNTPDLYYALGPICGLSTSCAPETEPNADTTALEQGTVSVSPLVVDGTPRPLLRLWLQHRIQP